MMEVPAHTKESWWNGLAQRLQHASSGQRGLSIIRITIIVDAGGNPIFWGEPEVTKVEPRTRASEFLNKIVQLL